MTELDKKIENINKTLCDNIESIDFLDRGLVSQNLLSQCRNLVEHVAMKIYSEKNDLIIAYDGIQAAMRNLKTDNNYLFLRKFHSFLQQTVSHYTPDYDGAERLVLKYYEYLLQVKVFYKERYNIELLQNIDKFPVDMDTARLEYYSKIVEKMLIPGIYGASNKDGERFYLQKSKVFFVNNKVYYENTLSLANDSASKFNRFVAFSTFKIPSNYAIDVTLVDEEIEIANKKMPIRIITEWRISIRPCELQNFAKIFGNIIRVQKKDREYIGIMNFLTKTGMNFVEIIDSSEAEYNSYRTEMTYKAQAIKFIETLDDCRKLVRQKKSGCNVLRYLLYNMNNKIMKEQLQEDDNEKLSGLKLKYGCIPFDKMPFATSLVQHNPTLHDLFGCISSEKREHELLARHISYNSTNNGQIYTKVSDVSMYGDINVLVKKFNQNLYNNEKHQKRRLEIFGEHIFISGNESKTAEILKQLSKLTETGIDGYKEYINDWLINNPSQVDCEEKKQILKGLFEKVKVAMIYGAAGTGKTTLIKHISALFDEEKKLYLTNTNPAIENLRRNVSAKNCEFMTIAKFLKYECYKCDLLFIDESSMVSNNDMIEVLKKSNYELLILAGDIYQIEAIEFGNWFGMARFFMPKICRYELMIPYRTKDNRLLKLWEKVRNLDEDVTEHIVNNGYSAVLDKTIFESFGDDEIILCLNYDGLYGINNINRFLQYSNPNPEVKWGVWAYKIGDPVLFNESKRFGEVLYNNLKGKIVDIVVKKDEIEFSIEIDRSLHELQAKRVELDLVSSLPNGKSVVRFSVNKATDTDEEEEDIDSIVPFQIAYAVSIHKAQGLEYDSVKLIITEEIDELITHNIFYTAITRTRNNLKIYWTPGSQQRVIKGMKKIEQRNDANILASRKKLKMIKQKK